MSSTENLLRQLAETAPHRFDLWHCFLREMDVRRMAEIGVYEGDFAASMLQTCSIEKYYLLDPWRHLADWNKPYNTDDKSFERIFQTASEKTEFARDRRLMLRGTTTEVIDQIPDGELDFAYIDGDHTLRGITIDMARVYPKIRREGFIGGDDFSPTAWYHGSRFEPTLVFPYAVYFAEAAGATIFALPNMQFLLQKDSGFRFVDLTGEFRDLSLLPQLRPAKLATMAFAERFPRLATLAAKMKQMFA